MNKTYLLLGSNIGNSKKQLLTATRQISKRIGAVIRSSSFYTTAAWGNEDQPDFLNQVLVVETRLSAGEAIALILEIEKKMGRIRTVKNAPRIIDIDILFFNKDIINTPSLTVPHPQIRHRRFVLVPLNELSPNFRHPVFQQSIHHLLKICDDPLPVKKI